MRIKFIIYHDFIVFYQFHVLYRTKNPSVYGS